MSQQGLLSEKTSSAADIETITGDTGGPVGPDVLFNVDLVGGATTLVNGNPGTNTLTIDASIAGYPITPYVVGPVGEAGYQTIQSAINAANLAGGGIIYIQPGTYTENLAMIEGVDLVGLIGKVGNIDGATQNGIDPRVNIVGNLSLDLTGASITPTPTFKNIKFIASSGVVFSTTGSIVLLESGYVTFIGCQFVGDTGASAIFFVDGFYNINFETSTIQETTIDTVDLLTYGATPFLNLFVRNSFIDVNSTNANFSPDGSFLTMYLENTNWYARLDITNGTQALNFQANLCTFSFDGGTPGDALITFGSNDGTIDLSNCLAFQASGSYGNSTNTTAASVFRYNNCIWRNPLVIGAIGRGDFHFCKIYGGTDPAVTMNSTQDVLFSECILDSSNNPAVTGSGTGTLTFIGCAFPDNTQLANTLTLAGNLIHGGNFITQFVVGNAPDAQYQTIQSALDAANATGVPQEIFVQPGTYTENLTLYVDQTIRGSIFGTLITGSHTPPTGAGSLRFTDVHLIGAPDILSSASAGTTNIVIDNCFITVVGGYIFDLPNWASGTLNIDNISEFSFNNGIANCLSGASVLISNSNIGQGTVNNLNVSNGSLTVISTRINCPISLGGSATATINEGVALFANITTTGTATASITTAKMITGAVQAITHNSSASFTISNSSIDSTNSPAIGGTGAGTIDLTGVDFINNSSLAATLTIAAGNSYSGTYKSDYTDHGVLLGQGSVSDIVATSAGTDGQVLIGATGADPVFGTITSITPTIEITEGTNTLNLDLTTNVENTAIHSWNGAIIEIADVTVTATGGVISCNVEKIGGGDLIAIFSDGFYNWDTTPPDTVTLTAGTDTSPQINYVYFLQSTKTLTASTSSFPTTEHVPICTTICQSAASLQTDGAYKVHVWTDHTIDVNNQGHVYDLNFWIRQQNATWSSGVNQTYTITPNGGAPDNVLITTLTGIVFQLHTHTFPAFSGTPDYYVINDSVTPYTIVNDLNALLTDSTGASMSGKYFSLVLWGVVSEATGDCKLFINLPSGSYNTQTGVENDVSQFANFNIPSDYKGTGFLISEWKLRHQVAASGTWTSIAEIDLRGTISFIAPAGSLSTPVEFADNTFRIFDDIDDTKEIAFQASAITTATTRTLTMIDADLDLANVASAFVTDSGSGIPAVGSLTIAGGSGISTTGSGNTVTITSTAAGIDWTEVTGTSQAMAVDNGYIANNAALVTLTLPDTAILGSILRIDGKGAGGWLIAQNAGETIHFLSQDTTTGVGGSLASSTQYDCVTLRCITADTDWIVESLVGNLTVI